MPNAIKLSVRSGFVWFVWGLADIYKNISIKEGVI
ncbi:hypothetical protein X564_10610 [Pseudoalteromonas agarivorans]|nr:hypothetical protein X564_10610 [Pseudoalteromonas agarivorans]